MSVDQLRRLAALEALHRPSRACSCRSSAETAFLIDFYECRGDGHPVSAANFVEARRVDALCSCSPDPRVTRLSDAELRAQIAESREQRRQAA